MTPVYSRIPVTEVRPGDVIELLSVNVRVREVALGADEVRVLPDGYPTQFYARDARVGCWRPS